MITKNKYGKGVLTSIFFPLLLNSSDLHSYDSESRRMHTKVDVSKGGRGGGGDLLCQGTNDLAWGGLALGELGGGRRKLWLFNKILTGY